MVERAGDAFVCGHPIAHSRSPAIHGYWLKTYGIAGSYKAVDVAPADPIRHAMFNINEIKQVPSIFSWGGPGSDPRERGDDTPHADFRAIADASGRIMVAMTHNTDIGDSMEREGDDPAYFAAFSPEGYALATNIVLYALTH